MEAAPISPAAFKGDLGAFLPQLELFQGIKASVLREFTAKLRVDRFDAHEILPPEPEIAKSCWIVLEGLVERRVISAEGRVTAIDVAAQGDIFGSLFSCCPVPLHVETAALAPSATGRLSHDDCRQILGHAPFFSQNLIRLLIQRLREARELRAMTGEPAPTRVLWSLLMLYSKLGADLPLSRSEMAEVAGVTRETEVRVLSPLEKDGVIRTRQGKIQVLDPRGLEKALAANRLTDERAHRRR